MSIVVAIAILLPWVLWLIYWIATSGRVKATVQREDDRSRRLQSIPLMVGGILLVLPSSLSGPAASAALPDTLAWTGLALESIGLGFSVWARQHLGTNWSVSVTLKQDHELVRSGPYGLVRHPIYTGCLLAMVGTLLLNAHWWGAVGLTLIFASLAYKVQVEERLLTGYFGQAYDRYREQVAALIPGLY